ncbi:hypothetical protein E4U13_007235 [Claviceps humidiphila]|uniref:Uncharacterized protein n=1 Tax=Claviceps humidiphila TaxID=1294629 RepID=A0A9P7PWM8_9HYPO|nr:hypothetical protein E4U13_007235 [Claviceps humidiphila]
MAATGNPAYIRIGSPYPHSQPTLSRPSYQGQVTLAPLQDEQATLWIQHEVQQLKCIILDDRGLEVVVVPRCPSSRVSLA